MPRQARQLSETGCYHICFRGVNHCDLFEEQADFEKLLELLAAAKLDMGFEVISFCLMDNHVHLMLKEKELGDVAQAMRKLLGPYAYWFNRKYGRSGALLANRYRSACVESDEYVPALVRYIHQNPLVAGIVDRIKDYRWTSYGDYIKARPALADTRFVLDMLSADAKKAIEEFKCFHETLEDRDL